MVTTRSASKAASPAPSATPSTSNRKGTSIPRSSAPPPPPPHLWAHTPSRTTLLWLAFSLPLVAWDSVYVLLRPLTMEGGSLHWPLYVPYRLYGEVDHVYGWKAFRARNGFTAAQGTLNVLESAMYIAYLYVYFSSRGPALSPAGTARARSLTGRPAAVALLIAFSAAVMTLSKTVLYWLIEYFSGFDNIGHNNAQDLITLWIIPNGLWLVFPTYLIYVMGGEIIQGLTAASSAVPIKSE
ncbi:hypothetical protein AAE478_002946 [Parahypoxylon ruwenzoriense]